MKKWFFAVLALLVLVTSSSFSFAITDKEACNNFFNGADYPRAIESGRRAVKTSTKDNSAYFCLGNALRKSGQLIEALDAYKQAERFSSKKIDLMYIYNAIGLTVEMKGDFDSALNYYERSLGFARELEQGDMERNSLNNIAGIFKENGQLDKSLAYYRKSLDLAVNEQSKSINYNNIATVYEAKGNYTSAIDYYQKSIDISLRYGDYHGAATSLINLGGCYRLKGDYTLAENTLLDGLERIRKAGDKFWEGVAYKFLGTLNTKTGDRVTARKYFKAALEVFNKNGAQGEFNETQALLKIINAPQIVAGIEIGAKGVKANVIEMTPTGDNDYNVDEKFRRSINTTIIAGVKERGEFDPSSIDETAKAVKDIYEQLAGEFQINPNDIFVAGSSALWKAKNKDKLADRVKELTGKELSFITVEQEVLFNIAGAIPPKYQDKSLSLDIGSGNTKIGYMDSSGGWNAVTTEIPLGTVTFTEAINKVDQSGDKFGATADKILKEQLLGKLRAESQKKPGYKNRRPVYLVGGIAWSIATLTHPGNQDGFMNLTLSDIDGFIKRLEKNSDTIYTVNLDKIKNTEVKEWTSKQVISIKDVFSTENLLAGAKLLKSVYGELKIKEAIFSRYGSWLWGFSSMQGMYRDQMAQQQVAEKK
jgi:tetratricopeptide (TPR) repeat protein